jgi:hypothetical protein
MLTFGGIGIVKSLVDRSVPTQDCPRFQVSDRIGMKASILGDVKSVTGDRSHERAGRQQQSMPLVEHICV